MVPMNKRKSYWLHIRLSIAERERLQRDAKRHGLRVSVYVREILNLENK